MFLEQFLIRCIIYFSKSCWLSWDRAQNMLIFGRRCSIPLSTFLAHICDARDFVWPGLYGWMRETSSSDAEDFGGRKRKAGEGRLSQCRKVDSRGREMFQKGAFIKGDIFSSKITKKCEFWSFWCKIQRRHTGWAACISGWISSL